MLTGMLNTNQKQLVNQFQNKSDYDKAQAIADICSQKGISKEQFQQIISFMNRR